MRKIGPDKQKNSPRLEKPNSKDSKRDRPYNIIYKIKDGVFRIANKKFILGIIAIIVLIAAVALWMGDDEGTVNKQSNNTSNPAAPVKNHFDNGNISFDYPQGWNISKEKASAPIMVTVQKNGNNSFSVLTENLGTSNFTERIIQWRESVMEGGNIYYEGWTTMDGSRAYEIEATYETQDMVYNTRGIAIEKYNTAYFIIFIFNTSLLDYKDEMDEVINSFHVK